MIDTVSHNTMNFPEPLLWFGYRFGHRLGHTVTKNTHEGNYSTGSTLIQETFIRDIWRYRCTPGTSSDTWMIALLDHQ